MCFKLIIYSHHGVIKSVRNIQSTFKKCFRKLSLSTWFGWFDIEGGHRKWKFGKHGYLWERLEHIHNALIYNWREIRWWTTCSLVLRFFCGWFLVLFSMWAISWWGIWLVLLFAVFVLMIRVSGTDGGRSRHRTGNSFGLFMLSFLLLWTTHFYLT